MQDSRDALGLHLAGSIIVVDEAHNLVDAINNTHCAQVSVNQLDAAEAQLRGYFERFRSRLAAGYSAHFCYNAQGVQAAWQCVTVQVSACNCHVSDET